MTNPLSKILILIITLGLSAPSFSADPKERLELVTNQISQEILANKDKIKADSEYAKSLIEQYLLPEVDTDYMTKRILGKTYWTEATETQRKTFTNEFIGLLLNSYAKGLGSYSGQKVTYDKTAYSTSGKTANVRSTIETDDQPILIDYRLKVQSDDSWLITDVIIEGVSMAKSYASQYRDQIKQVGLEATLEKLAEENARAAEATKITDTEA
ncbi:phospholipid-binding protein MlaC [Kangiella sp. TOML190]|uniref:MlaC/ttg2D family ABC transporter substrate-binding protein n=1 Tax=Kangiella sp. TOML190 TaxID=2931351 RepID=UPI00203B969F|nr:ABC transporter substrate-binding protein [Kangiella sp. TOML190]